MRVICHNEILTIIYNEIVYHKPHKDAFWNDARNCWLRIIYDTSDIKIGYYVYKSNVKFFAGKGNYLRILFF